MKKSTLALLVIGVLVLVLSGNAIVQISVNSYAYLQVRYDRTLYTFNNAIAEVGDPVNLKWQEQH